MICFLHFSTWHYFFLQWCYKYDTILVLTVFRNSRIVLKAAVEIISSFFIACPYINLSPAFHSGVLLNCLFCSGFNGADREGAWPKHACGHVRILNVSLLLLSKQNKNVDILVNYSDYFIYECYVCCVKLYQVIRAETVQT